MFKYYIYKRIAMKLNNFKMEVDMLQKVVGILCVADACTT